VCHTPKALSISSLLSMKKTSLLSAASLRILHARANSLLVAIET
jgi:hypothetical protein